MGVGLVLVAAAAATFFAVRGCESGGVLGADVGTVNLGGKDFHLELALDPETRFHGLSGRTFIEPDGGMLFAFPSPLDLSFVMRDCPIPIDIVFIDSTGRITAMHEMTPEPPRTEDEKVMDPATGTNTHYEDRLKKYPSRFDAQFVIEVAGGTLKTLPLKAGDKVDLDVKALKRRAK
jgi:uncharacterized membrane protein (UPF0127 family)